MQSSSPCKNDIEWLTTAIIETEPGWDKLSSTALNTALHDAVIGAYAKMGIPAPDIVIPIHWRIAAMTRWPVARLEGKGSWGNSKRALTNKHIQVQYYRSDQ